jgi:hypothetical protein
MRLTLLALAMAGVFNTNVASANFDVSPPQTTVEEKAPQDLQVMLFCKEPEPLGTIAGIYLRYYRNQPFSRELMEKAGAAVREYLNLPEVKELCMFNELPIIPLKVRNRVILKELDLQNFGFFKIVQYDWVRDSGEATDRKIYLPSIDDYPLTI